jgi:hypothetical protein
MRDAKEIEHLQTALNQQASESLEWQGDNFKYGLYCGKVLAMAWMMGETSTGEMGVQYEYEDFIRQRSTEIDDLLRKIWVEPSDEQEDQTE